MNAVAPSVVRTQFSQPFWSNESLLQEILRTIPAGRIAEPGDLHQVAGHLVEGHVVGDVLGGVQAKGFDKPDHVFAVRPRHA